VLLAPPDDVWQFISDPKYHGKKLCSADGQRLVLELLKAAYGLNDAPRPFWEAFEECLLKNEHQQSAHDPCVFSHFDQETPKQTSKLDGIISTHVDDGAGGATEQYLKWLIKILEQNFGEIKLVTKNFNH